MLSDFEKTVGGKNYVFSTGEMAKQADGAVTVQCGGTIVLATAVSAKEADASRDFFPLSIEFKEKFYAAGRIPGGYIKREGRPSDYEVLICRITDRPLRPLFPKDYLNEVQIIIYVLSSDKIEQADVLAINAASAALSVSDIPFRGPVGGVRVGRVEGQLILNPTYEQMESSDIDLVVAGTDKAVTMIEGHSKNITEEEMLEAVTFAHDHIKQICEVQKQLKEQCGKTDREYSAKEKNSGVSDSVRAKYTDRVKALADVMEKKAREDAYSEVLSEAVSEFEVDFPDDIDEIGNVIHDIDKESVRERILNGERADGRKLDEIRPITVKTGILPGAHGSALFTRGQTQSLGIVTLGTEKDNTRIDKMVGEETKYFFLHYNFPPFSVGECGRVGGTGRREIGHGMLAERSLTYTVPDFKEFPYSIRVVSEILESNGSSSMASVCSGSLALMDAGVNIKAPIAGIAMGLVMEGDRHAILSDIQGIEDHLGDMDFKVAGTAEGITAFQLDIKIEGITTEIMKEALEQARVGRLHILNEMNKSLAVARSELSPTAPRIFQMSIKESKIGELIGTGGKNIKSIIEQTGSEISVDESGGVLIYAPNQEILKKTQQLVEMSVAEVERNKIYEGTVKRIADFGAFVEILPGKEGLLHISKIDTKRIRKVTDVLNLGDKVKVKVTHIDKGGRIDLSRKDAMEQSEE
jgi:polyribonucleotide nucleotidyltransferase